MIVVADASPLIFLGKIERLGLLPDLFPGQILVPALVKTEVLAGPASPAELLVLSAFLGRCSIVDVRREDGPLSAMSQADQDALALAVTRKARILLADDRLLRTLAEAQHIRPMGTLGVLLRAMRERRIEPPETRELVDTLVGEHGFRIGIEVYQKVLLAIDAGPAPPGRRPRRRR